MKIIIGSDHAGYTYKQALIQMIEKKEISYVDCGTNGPDSVAYPDYAHAVSNEVLKDNFNVGILICGSANGVAMAANKHKGIRAAVCWNEEIASLAVTHNNSNVLCIPARFISTKSQEKILDAFLGSTFEGGRHKTRVDKINS